jgi:MFS family permease
VFIISLVQFCEAFNANSLFAYVGFMVLDFNIVDDEAEVGYYVGLIASAFFFCQFLSGFWWGRLSDRYGRRPILLIGLCGSFMSAAMFGFSKHLAFAVCSRAVSGLLNGNLGVVKTYLGEVTDKTNQARAISFLSLSWGIGSIVGPLAGGFLSQPTLKYDWWPDNILHGLLHTYPFLLPSLITSLITVVAFIMVYFFLPETLPRTGYQKEYKPLLGETKYQMATENPSKYRGTIKEIFF